MKTINVRLIAWTVYLTVMIGGLLVLSTLAGCAGTDAVEAYAREHNIIGERVCNTQVEDVVLEDVLARGCPTSDIDNNTGNIQNEVETFQKQEEAL